MRRSSRSKSHKQSKHKEYTDSEEDVVKMKEKNGKDSRDLPSGEKRKLASQSKEGKDPSGHGNGDASEEYVASKRRKEKTDDRWNGGGDERGDAVVVDKETKVDMEKSSKSKDSKGLGDSKSKSSRSSVVEKEESKGGSRVESKRKSEKESGRKESHQPKDLKELKDKERKVQDVKVVDGEMGRKQGTQLVDLSEDKRGRDDKDCPIQDELRNPELEKELEKRIKRRGDGSSDKDKYQDDVRENDDRRLSSKGDRVKDGRNKDERHKDASHIDKHREDGEKDYRHREDKYRDEVEKESRHRDLKYRGDGERDNRHRDDKYREDCDRDNRHRDEKYRQDGIKENRRKEAKYRDDGERDNRHREDKYREDGDRDDRYKDDKYREVGDRDRHKEEKHREDADRDSRHRDGKQGDDIAREKRARDVKYRDEHTSRHRTSESDSKRLRDESKTADPHHRKLITRDGSPMNDDRASRYKDDKGRRRAHDEEEQSDIRPRSTKEQRSDAEKRPMSSAKLDLATDRGRSVSRIADVEITTNHSRRRNSPSSSSHAARDHYRVSNQEESKYRDYGYDERVRHNATSNREYAVPGSTEKISSSRSLEKSSQKDDSHLGDLSAERRLRSDTRGSPLHLVDKSPSSTSNDRRHSNRPDVRRSLDVEESGHRSGGFKDYSGKEGKGSREFPMETHPGDELSQADGDNISISSPYTRTNNFSGNSRSLLPPPPPPFRTGVDSPSVFGSAEDDNRGKSNNRHRRIGDPNMGRPQGGGWKGVPTWPSPVANGFMPFQHGQPPVGFHPVMQQFPGPPLYGVRPPMELNHSVPYHIPDSDRFSGHGRPLHGWDANNAAFGDESHMYGRLDWDHNRTQMNGRRWETSGDMWKGQNSRMSADLPSVPPKADSAHGPEDEVWAGQSDQQTQNELSQPEFQVESINVNQFSDTPQRNAPEVPKTTAEAEESPEMSKMSKKDDVQLCHVYLSKLDISADLVQPELYDQCTSLLDIDQNAMSDEDDFKILYMEEVVEAKVKISDKTSSASLFAVINDSVFQKAMSLYKKQREETVVISGEQVTVPTVEGYTFVPTSDVKKAGSSDGKPGEPTQTCDGQEDVEVTVSHFDPEKAQEPSKLEEVVSSLNEVRMEVDLVPIQEEAEVKLDVSSEEPIEDKASSLENAEHCDHQLPGSGEDLISHSANNEEEKMVDTNCGGPLLFTHVSSEAVMPESFESGSVNLSRIHHSPESTH